MEVEVVTLAAGVWESELVFFSLLLFIYFISN